MLKWVGGDPRVRTQGWSSSGIVGAVELDRRVNVRWMRGSNKINKWSICGEGGYDDGVSRSQVEPRRIR